MLRRHRRHGRDARGPHRHDRDARQPAGAPGIGADQHAGPRRRHAACRRAKTRPDRVRAHHRGRPHHHAALGGAALGRPRGHERRGAGALLPRRRQLDLLRSKTAHHAESRARPRSGIDGPARLVADVLKQTHALARHIAGEQSHADKDHQAGGADLDAAQDQRAVAGARCGKPLRQTFRADRERRDRRDRDRGSQPHHEGRGDAGPEQALRQREDQHDDGTRAGPQSDGYYFFDDDEIGRGCSFKDGA